MTYSAVYTIWVLIGGKSRLLRKGLRRLQRLKLYVRNLNLKH